MKFSHYDRVRLGLLIDTYGREQEGAGRAITRAPKAPTIPATRLAIALQLEGIEGISLDVPVWQNSARTLGIANTVQEWGRFLHGQSALSCQVEQRLSVLAQAGRVPIRMRVGLPARQA